MEKGSAPRKRGLIVKFIIENAIVNFWHIHVYKMKNIKKLNIKLHNKESTEQNIL